MSEDRKNKKFLSIILITTILCSIYILRNADFGFSRSLGALKDKACVGLNTDALVSDEDRANFKNLKKNVETLTGTGNHLEIAVEKNDYSDYIQRIIIVTAPWIVFLALSILGWICYCCCCFCDGRCFNKDPSKRKGNDKKINQMIEKFKKRAPSKTCLLIVAQFTILLVVGMAAICLAGFAYASSVEKGTKVLVCATLAVADEFVYGTNLTTGERWLGYYGVINQLQYIKNDINSTITAYTNTFSNTGWLSTTINSMNSKNSQINSNYNGKQLKSCNPSNPTGTVPSTFLSSGIGPTTSKTTMTGSIQYEIDTKNKIMVTVLDTLKSFSQILTSNTGTITNGIDSSINSIKQFQPKLDSFVKTANDNVDSLDVYLKGVTTGIYGFWSIVLVISIVVFIGILFGYILSYPKFRIFLHLGWCFICFIMIFGFIFCALFVPISYITLDGCGILEKMVSNQTYYNKAASNLFSINSDVKSNIDICLFGNGDLITSYNLSTHINKITDVSKSLDNWTTTSTNSSVSNLSVTSSAIDVWINTSTKYESGLYPDSSATNDDNPTIALNSLTSYSDYSATNSQQSTAGCSQTRDEWKFNLDNCTYTNKWVASNAPGADYGNQVCIDINSFTTTSTNTRYTNLATSCTTIVKVRIDQYFNGLKNYDSDRRTVFGDIKTRLISLKSENDVLATNVNNLNTKVLGFKNNTLNLIKNVTDPKLGLLAGFNCKFIKVNIVRMQESICMSFLPAVYTITALIISVSIVMFFTSFFSYKLAMVIHNKHKADKISYRKVAAEEKL